MRGNSPWYRLWYECCTLCNYLLLTTDTVNKETVNSTIHNAAVTLLNVHTHMCMLHVCTVTSPRRSSNIRQWIHKGSDALIHESDLAQENNESEWLLDMRHYVNHQGHSGGSAGTMYFDIYRTLHCAQAVYLFLCFELLSQQTASISLNTLQQLIFSVS
jgi:hypothetical protein